MLRGAPVQQDGRGADVAVHSVPEAAALSHALKGNKGNEASGCAPTAADVAQCAQNLWEKGCLVFQNNEAGGIGGGEGKWRAHARILRPRRRRLRKQGAATVAVGEEAGCP